MDKFWKWMYEKGYGDDANEHIYTYDLGSNPTKHSQFTPTKQMLVGYKYQYCMENDIEIHYSFKGIDELCEKLDGAINGI